MKERGGDSEHATRSNEQWNRRKEIKRKRATRFLFCDAYLYILSTRPPNPQPSHYIAMTAIKYIIVYILAYIH